MFQGQSIRPYVRSKGTSRSILYLQIMLKHSLCSTTDEYESVLGLFLFRLTRAGKASLILLLLTLQLLV
jgi:hypothetical protein